jgi:Cu(I)/Ag(I) efflux system membrane fusion protein
MNRRTLLILAAAVAVLIGASLWIAHRHGNEQMAAPGQTAKKAKYQCSMHPQIVSDKPGNCPICGMKLTPVVDEETSPKSDQGAVPGHESISLSTERQQLIGVKTGPVERRDLTLDIRAGGQVAYDPELYNALAEYREAASARGKLSAQASAETRERVDTLVRSATLRLKLMGIAQDQIQEMLKDNADPVNLLLPGKKVWVYAQVYEQDADQVRPGQPVTVTIPSAPSRPYTGRVAAVDQVLNAATRTLRVRIEIASPQGRLRPESFVRVKIQVPLGSSLAIPEDAVLDTGEHQVVFVKEGEGRFEPRSVELGKEAEGYYEVLSGVKDGEEVVTSANFLIDSESRFRSALSAFSDKAPEHIH